MFLFTQKTNSILKLTQKREEILPFRWKNTKMDCFYYKKQICVNVFVWRVLRNNCQVIHCKIVGAEIESSYNKYLRVEISSATRRQ